MLQTVRAEKGNEKNGVICLVFMFPSWVVVLKLSKKVHIWNFVLTSARNLSLLKQFTHHNAFQFLEKASIRGERLREAFIKFLQLCFFFMKNHFLMTRYICCWSLQKRYPRWTHTKGNFKFMFPFHQSRSKEQNKSIDNSKTTTGNWSCPSGKFDFHNKQ